MKIPTFFYVIGILTGSMFICCKSHNSIPKASTQNSISPTYQQVANWPNLPDNFVLGNPTGIAQDTNQNIVFFHRGTREWEEPMDETPIPDETILVLDQHSGNILDSWGANIFMMPHGLEIDDQNNFWLTDVGLHQVFKFGPSGDLLFVLGEAKVPGDDKDHFNLPTDVAVAEDGSFYVSDGYGNSRVVKFSPDGDYIMEWGSYGDEAGQFDTPHGIDLDPKGNVYVADRENNRIQKFTPDGAFISQWQNTESDQLYSVNVDTTEVKLFAIDYFIDGKEIIGSDIFQFELDLQPNFKFGRSGNYEGPISRYHDIQVDNEGCIYVGDILNNTIQKFCPNP